MTFVLWRPKQLKNSNVPLKGFSIIPLLVVRSAGRVATISAAVITPLSLILDAGIVAYSAYNLAKGSRTNVTENLRTISVLLRKMRIQSKYRCMGHSVSNAKQNKINLLQKGWIFGQTFG